MKQCKCGSAYDDASPDSAVYIFRFDLSSLRRLSAIRLHNISGGKRTWKTLSTAEIPEAYLSAQVIKERTYHRN